jgi:hypothetical protein
MDRSENAKTPELTRAIIVEEYWSLRSQVDTHTKEIYALGKFALGAIGALYAWVFRPPAEFSTPNDRLLWLAVALAGVGLVRSFRRTRDSRNIAEQLRSMSPSEEWTPWETLVFRRVKEFREKGSWRPLWIWVRHRWFWWPLLFATVAVALWPSIVRGN